MHPENCWHLKVCFQSSSWEVHAQIPSFDNRISELCFENIYQTGFALTGTFADLKNIKTHSTNYCPKSQGSQLQLIPCLIFYLGSIPCLSDRIHSGGTTKLNFEHWCEFFSISTILEKNGICFLHMISTWERKQSQVLLWSFTLNKNYCTF